jgi:Fe-Mn family superoxide dismutase
MIDKAEIDKIASGIIDSLQNVNLAKKEKLVISEDYSVEKKKITQNTQKVSDKTKEYHENLYSAYVDSLNFVSAKISAYDMSKGSLTEFAALKRDETRLLNAVYLHDLFFENSFDQSSELFSDMSINMSLQRDFGTLDKWVASVLDCALSCQPGWVVMGWSKMLKKFVLTTIVGHDNSVQVGLIPVLVIDMWEHSYRDYMMDKKAYVNAMLGQINWEVVDKRSVSAQSEK